MTVKLREKLTAIRKVAFIRTIWSELKRNGQVVGLQFIDPNDGLILKYLEKFKEFYPPRWRDFQNPQEWIDYYKGVIQILKRAYYMPKPIQEAYLRRAAGKQRHPTNMEIRELGTTDFKNRVKHWKKMRHRVFTNRMMERY